MVGPLKVKQTEGQLKRFNILVAELVTSILIDEGLLEVQVEKVTTALGVRTHKYVTFTKHNVKDVYKGIMDKAGVVLQKDIAGRKPNNAQKTCLALLSSQAYELHTALSQAVLHKFYTLKPDWNKTHDKNGNEIKWVGAYKRKHYKDMAAEVMELQDCIYYIAHKFDNRLRVGPEANRLEGINLHGKSFETGQHCAANYKDINDQAYRMIEQQLYSARHNRVTVQQAVDNLSSNDYLPVTEDIMLAATSQKEMANLHTAKKALKSMQRHAEGKPCGNLFGWDFTFSGGIMAGLLFKSPEFLQSGNLYGEDKVTDAHARFGELFGLSGIDRDTVKDMQQPVMHGGHISGLLKVLADHGFEMSEAEVKRGLTGVYGECVGNVNIIAEWGQALACSEYATMTWTMPDNMISAHKAYQSGIAVENYVASATSKRGYTHNVQLSNLPYETTNTGKPLYAKEMTIGHTNYKVTTHLRGLFADILHSVDAYVLRRVVKAVTDQGYTILVKHDNFYIQPAAYPTLIKAAKKVFRELLHSNLLHNILTEISERSHKESNVPEIVYGEAQDLIEESHNFLLP